METLVFNGNADFTVKSFKAKTTTFNNTKKLSAKDFIDIETKDFTNTNGRLQTHGNGKIKVNGLFRNTGGGRLEKDKAETITNYIWNGSQLVPQQQTFYRDVYYPDLGRAGVITSGKFLDITADRFDNSFGILNTALNLNQLITLTLTPIYGRNILLNVDLVGQLMRTGSTMAETFRGTQSLMLRSGDPAILFDRSSNPDVEVEVDGERMMVPLYNPFLLTDAVSRLLNTIHAEKLLHIQSLGNIRLEPGQINLESEDLTLESQRQVQIAAEYVYNETGNRVGVTPVDLSIPGTLALSGREGVRTRGAQPSARTLRMDSSHGSIVDLEMPLDPTYTFLRWGNVSMSQRTFTSTLRASDEMSFVAPEGTVDQHGTDMIAGPGGILFDAQQHVWSPVYEEAGFFHSDRKGFARTHVRAPKVGSMQTPGSVIFRSKDTTLMGAQVVAGIISNPTDGTLRMLPAYTTQKSHSYTTKSGFCGLGRSSLEVEETRELVEPTRLMAEHFESLGVGTYEMESTIIKALDATITKNLVERTAHDRIHSRITQKSSGFCAPKIKGDPLAGVLRGVRNVVTLGDALPTAFNIVGTAAQTLTHATTLANLSSNPNPFTAVASIFLSRFMTGAVISNTRTVTERHESRPSQSQVDVGALLVSNDRTHLEGV